ncbi:NAD(P)-dependent oxidoreductase [Hoeflea sp. WL0058]|uniref:NAD(P)-dependent oxidoreductase n=1 Tax=Flavimaribacter sediminis TaxID=2865987 RepID=A0AAE2ZLH5_9HYPH|nr:NAD(P)-dependent oxidoreductase [Flavimaribacter sediminis]MBW8638174.1 NAD(P)-dependent oxidoreductase [Flavimaribacter sediminis]
MQENLPRIGFIGLGAMGKPMARCIANAGYSLTVLDADMQLTENAAQDLQAAAASSASALAQDSDIVVTMLPNSAIVSEVLSRPNGVFAGLTKGGLILEMSSGVPDMTKELAATAERAGLVLLDAPVSGGVPRARTGELAIMVGGEDTPFEGARAVLETMGTVMRTGPVGSAHAMKALNNLVSAGGFLIGVEALLIGSRFGLDPSVMVDVLNASTGMNNSTQKKFKQYVLSRKFDAGFGLDLMVKDLGIALGVAETTETAAPLAGLCREIWRGAQKYLGPGQDHTAMAQFCEMMAGSVLEDSDERGNAKK